LSFFSGFLAFIAVINHVEKTLPQPPQQTNPKHSRPAKLSTQNTPTTTK
jgi:hypothetical protein